MIRRILHELNVSTLASNVRRRVGDAIAHAVYVDSTDTYGVFILGRSTGAGYILEDAHHDNWPEGAAILHIGRVTLAAWGGRSS
jgi:hypothetical protein